VALEAVRAALRDARAWLNNFAAFDETPTDAAPFPQRRGWGAPSAREVSGRATACPRFCGAFVQRTLKFRP
jgi:hypothetical protein